ncbi:unnamed protein product [Rhizophagus irregularis]|nr:unnamed protein product [Rhizophagus irregularis]
MVSSLEHTRCLKYLGSSFDVIKRNSGIVCNLIYLYLMYIRWAEVTEVDMILAEEKEREERIMKEFGIQKTPISRRACTNFNVHNYNYNTYKHSGHPYFITDHLSIIC